MKIPVKISTDSNSNDTKHVITDSRGTVPVLSVVQKLQFAVWDRYHLNRPVTCVFTAGSSPYLLTHSRNARNDDFYSVHWCLYLLFHLLYVLYYTYCELVRQSPFLVACPLLWFGLVHALHVVMWKHCWWEFINDVTLLSIGLLVACLEPVLYLHITFYRRNMWEDIIAGLCFPFCCDCCTTQTGLCDHHLSIPVKYKDKVCILSAPLIPSFLFKVWTSSSGAVQSFLLTVRRQGQRQDSCWPYVVINLIVF